VSETEPALEPVVSAWRAIAASHAAACAALEREMGKRHGLGVSEFEVLDRLAESGRSDFRSQELAEAVHLSQSALSRLIDRLEKDGLVAVAHSRSLARRQSSCNYINCSCI
jgi:DNA-binding MarR family transcriptional regulator